MAKCTECGSTEDSGKFCGQCGAALKTEEAAPKAAPGPSAPLKKGEDIYHEKGAGTVSVDQKFRTNCPLCELPIPAGKITCEGNDYHLACFKCKKCDKKLNLAQYRKLDNKFYCGECIDTNGSMYQAWKLTDDAKRFAQKKEEVKASTGGNVMDMGCYLSFDTASGGSLFLNWKNEQLPGAVAYFKPKKTVPKFKFTSGGGKSELTRGCETSQMMNYYIGMCNFIKMANEFQGSFVLLSSDVAAVFAHVEGDKVVQWEKGQWQDTTALPKLCVSVCPHASTSYKGVKTMGKDAFISAGNGASLNIK
jgi:hypothetical protein